LQQTPDLARSAIDSANQPPVPTNGPPPHPFFREYGLLPHGGGFSLSWKLVVRFPPSDRLTLFSGDPFDFWQACLLFPLGTFPLFSTPTFGNIAFTFQCSGTHPFSFTGRSIYLFYPPFFEIDPPDVELLSSSFARSLLLLVLDIWQFLRVPVTAVVYFLHVQTSGVSTWTGSVVRFAPSQDDRLHLTSIQGSPSCLV